LVTEQQRQTERLVMVAKAVVVPEVVHSLAVNLFRLAAVVL
jgi:hypothetical protein